MTVQLNLLPDVKKEYIKAQKTKALVISASILTTIVAAGLSVLLLLYVTFGQQLQISLISGDIENKTQQLNNVKDLSKYLTIQNQLTALPELHDQKGIYSRLFTILPIVNPSAPNNIKLSTLQVTTAEKTMSFTGSSATFESLNIFVDTLTNAQATYKNPEGQTSTEKILKSVSVQSSGLARINNASTVSFVLVVEYNESVFDARNTNVTAEVPNIETTPSVTGSPGQQLFDDESGGQ